MAEENAIRGFYAATHIVDGLGGIDKAISSVARSVTLGSENLSWLNAYNAPHWMNIYKAFDIPNDPPGKNGFLDRQGNQENYATSWVHDLLKAWTLQKNNLAAALGPLPTGYNVSTWQLQMNGLTDPGYGSRTISGSILHNTGNHSVGMGVDLGIGQWISEINQNNQDAPGANGNNPTVNITTVAGSGWDVDRARQLANLLPGTLRNNQQQAVRDFLALYTLARMDSAANNGSWEELVLQNGEAVRAALFGDGSKDGGLIAKVFIGGEGKAQPDGSVTGQNPFENINKVLGSGLGIVSQPYEGHNTHFHLVIRTPKRLDIAQSLLADDSSQVQTIEEGGDALIASAQALLAGVSSQTGSSHGDLLMLVMDTPPDVPTQYAPVIIAETPQVKPSTQRVNADVDRTIGVCQLVRNAPFSPETAINAFMPLNSVEYYLNTVEKKFPEPTGKVTLLKGPEHGQVKEIENQIYRYISKPDYVGPDSATFLVEIGGLRIKAIYSFNVDNTWGGGTDGYDPYEDKKLCPNGRHWKISLNPDDPNAPIYTFEHPYQLTSPYAGLSNVNLSFGPLAPGALGQTTGDTITLDPTAAGFGWFIDSTPWDNSEFLPTHDPDVWVARAGSEASGRMDLLSVLLHEYGHVLGIDHSADHSDYMATTLTPGTRRLPSRKSGTDLFSRKSAEIRDRFIFHLTPDIL